MHIEVCHIVLYKLTVSILSNLFLISKSLNGEFCQLQKWRRINILNQEQRYGAFHDFDVSLELH